MKNLLIRIRSLLLLCASLGFISVFSCSHHQNNPVSAAEFQKDKMVPKVLFITSGIGDEITELPEGIIIALQAFNKKGAIVRLETRAALHDKKIMDKYNILIISTSPLYHDADRKYSLSFMSDDEMRSISEFVREGGILIAGDNIGRNLIDGTDRIVLYQNLSRDNFVLSACLGVNLTERNMIGYGIHGNINENLKGYFRNPYEEDKWTLIPDTVHSSNVEIMGYWYKASDSIPAIIKNKFGKGISYLFPSSDFFHPANEGGIWSAADIMEFYSYVLRDFNEMNDIPLTLNPWPGGREYAFCLTFNSEGSLDEYQRLFTKLRKWQLEPFFFVNGKVNYEIMDFLKKNDVSLGSNGFSYRNYRNFMYPDAFNDIVENELFWEIDFNGFRFPFTTTGYWGILALLENDYSFTSSIGANNIEFFHGSVFPYNHVISQNKYYKTTEILEVAPIYHDDYHFLKDVKLPELSPLQLNNGVKLYSKYLTNYWNRAVKPYKGLMVYLGHPAYVAYNDTTLSALDSLMLEVAESENTWITSIEEVVKFRNHLSAFNFFVYQNGDEIRLETKGPENIRIDDVSFLLSDTLNVNNASSSVGKASISKNAGKKFLIFDVLDGKVIVLK